MIKFCSRSKDCKTPYGAVRTGENISLKIAVSKGLSVDGAVFIYRSNLGGGDQRFAMMKKGFDKNGRQIFVVTYSIQEEGVYFYRFELFSGENILFVGRTTGGNAIIGDWLPEWQQTIYSKDYQPPKFLKGGVIYHIFADRFCKVGPTVNPPFGVKKNWNDPLTIVDADGVYRANDFYGGNFKGITSKLDYIKSLGVNLIYLSPIFLSHSNHRYDTADYMQLDPLLGTEDDFIELINEAKARDIGIMLDGVFNHTGADSVYFNKFNHFSSLGAYQSKNSTYYNWYTFQRFPDEYTCWWGVTVVPTIRRDAESFHTLITGPDGVIDKWTKMGVKGWRLDVVDELSDDFVVKIKKAVKSANKDAVLIGEVWEDASTKVSYNEHRKYLFGNELDGVMNYPYKDAILNFVKYGDIDDFIERVETIEENYPKDILDNCMTLIGSHDTVRAINELGNTSGVEFVSKADKLHFRMSDGQYKYARSNLLIGSALQYFLPGVPSLYYGDEMGMQGFEDPLNRAPMLWDGDEAILSHYKNLGALRAKFRDDFLAPLKIIKHDGYFELKRNRISLLVNLGSDVISLGNVKKTVFGENEVNTINAQSVLFVLNKL